MNPETFKKFLPHALLALACFVGSFAGTLVGNQFVTWVRTPSVPVAPKPPQAPIAVEGLTVLIVEESATRSAAFADLIANPELRAWMKTNCVADKTGMPSFRVFDKDTNLSNALPVWRLAMAAVKADPEFQEELKRLEDDPDRKFGPNFHEWLLVATPKGGYVGPLPTLKPLELIEFLKPYAGIKPQLLTPGEPARPAVQPPPPAEPVFRDCENCGGTGMVRLRLFRTQSCPECGGSGKVK